MLEFETYAKSNWKVDNAASCGVKYTHSTRESTDRKSNTRLVNNTVNMTLTWFDKDNVQLRTEKLSFVNDDMNKSSDKLMFTINRKELVNKFRAAKTQIVNKIIEEKNEKLSKIQSEIAALQRYCGRNDDVIPQSMKGSITIASESTLSPRTSSESKPSFDM